MPFPYTNVATIATTEVSASRKLSGKSKQTLASATQDCYIAFDANSVSTTGGFFVKAGEQYIFDMLYPTKIAAIRSSQDGRLSIMEMGDVILQVTETATFTGDANIKLLDIATAFDSDASIKAVLSDTYSSDSSLKAVIPATITSDTNLKISVSATATGDTNLKSADLSSTWTGNASLT